MEFIQLDANNPAAIEEMSQMATAIVRDYYDPIIGVEQNTYMLKMFQSPEGIRRQLAEGSHYYTAKDDGRAVGFFSYDLHKDYLYLCKFYLYAHERGKGYGRQIINFLIEVVRKTGLARIELNVNKHNDDSINAYKHMGFQCIRKEKNAIGQGYYMDDYVYALEFFPIVDEEGLVVGMSTRSECHGGSMLLHPVVHLHVFNSRGELYLQKRPAWKDIQPNRWDTAVGGHIDWGEKPEDALYREVREELGITDFTPEFITKYVFQSQRERELVYVHRTQYDGPITPAADELDGGRFWSIADIRAAIGQGVLTPNFENEFQRFFSDLK